jgi:hypothetical protein
MRFAIVALSLATIFLAGCGPEPKPAPPVKKAAAKPADATRYFTATNRVEVKIVDDHLFGHDFLPGGNIAHYSKGKQEYDVFLIKTSGPEAAALLLLDYKQKLTNPKVIAIFGGFAGKDGDRPAFLFAKGPWLCGVLDLPEAEADLVSRDLAARLN